MTSEWTRAKEALLSGKLAVIPTDTIYGVTACAFKPEAIKLLDGVKKRSNSDPYIILIADQKDLALFGVELSQKQSQFLTKIWPGPVSLILSPTNKELNYLYRHKNIALRLPDNDNLRNLIRQTGPLAAPSANPAGAPPAQTIEEAKAYFGESVASYVHQEQEPFIGQASTLVDLSQDEPKILRQGKTDITKAISCLK